MGKLSISMAIFNSKLLAYQAGYQPFFEIRFEKNDHQSIHVGHQNHPSTNWFVSPTAGVQLKNVPKATN